MKILLLGEYSNVHHTLAEALKALGHDVTLASDGDGWKNYPRDIDLKRASLGKIATLKYLIRTVRQFRHFRGYDIVQLINPLFLDLKPSRVRPFYNYLRRHNRRIVMGAYGMDYYYVKGCLDCQTFRYSDFNFGEQIRESQENDLFLNDWFRGSKGVLNRYISENCDAIVAGLYEYYACYKKYFPQPEKLSYIPFPVTLEIESRAPKFKCGDPVKFFLGVQQTRSVYKGTDIMERALQRVHQEYPEACEVCRVESVPFEEYVNLMNASHVILDQLYSYTPGMNGLEAMSRGLINVGGGEEEMYGLMEEDELRPIVNVKPNEESVYLALKELVERRDELIPKLQEETLRFIHRHHEAHDIALRYEKLYHALL